MSLPETYAENYDLIAKDHVKVWRKTGENPFQPRWFYEWNLDVTEALIRRHVPVGAAVLDAGCGIGDLLMRLADYDAGGVEIALPYLDVLQERGLTFSPGALEAMEFADGCFDAVVATDVLEHVLDLHAATKELLRVLKPGGHIIIRVPNMEPVAWGEDTMYHFVHLRILDEGTMRMLLERIFDCEVLEAFVFEETLHMCARKNGAA